MLIELHFTLINFLSGSGLLSVIFMMTPLVNWGPWLVAFSLLLLFSSRRKTQTNIIAFNKTVTILHIYSDQQL